MNILLGMPDKRTRRTRAQLDALLHLAQQIIDGEEGRISIRHLFYRLASEHQVIPKTDAAYNSLLGHLAKWRRSGDIAWDSFTDNTRWHIKRRTFDSITDALENTVRTYRRNLWDTQDVYVEIWTEKDAIASILSSAATLFGAPVFICRGFASLTSIYDAAETFKENIAAGKRVIVYHFGDCDPSGVAAGESIQRSFCEDFDVEVEFIRAAVTPEQIEEHSLPSRPVKKSDTRAARWGDGGCVEIDTMRPAILKGLVQDCITRHIDRREWEMMERTEAMERETLEAFSVAFQQGEAQ